MLTIGHLIGWGMGSVLVVGMVLWVRWYDRRLQSRGIFLGWYDDFRKPVLLFVQLLLVALMLLTVVLACDCAWRHQ